MVYGALARELNRVKIGYHWNSWDPVNEDEALRYIKGFISPVPLELVFLFPGGREVEEQLHEKFDDRRLYREWFDASVIDEAILMRPSLERRARREQQKIIARRRDISPAALRRELAAAKTELEAFEVHADLIASSAASDIHAGTIHEQRQQLQTTISKLRQEHRRSLERERASRDFAARCNAMYP